MRAASLPLAAVRAAMPSLCKHACAAVYVLSTRHGHFTSGRPPHHTFRFPSPAFYQSETASVPSEGRGGMREPVRARGGA